MATYDIYEYQIIIWSFKCQMNWSFSLLELKPHGLHALTWQPMTQNEF